MYLSMTMTSSRLYSNSLNLVANYGSTTIGATFSPTQIGARVDDWPFRKSKPPSDDKSNYEFDLAHVIMGSDDPTAKKASVTIAWDKEEKNLRIIGTGFDSPEEAIMSVGITIVELGLKPGEKLIDATERKAREAQG